ncbi:synaptic vesicle membrane protein VAT-1 homolog-like isoform X2 [Lineus longissimus]|uniref:synaptic vesicle membrane protein VAT-1 homolog-like isoform X2 n=1 Tax=Lineus longissimus TaxID=88925 RepID=UPI002B4E6F30
MSEPAPSDTAVPAATDASGDAKTDANQVPVKEMRSIVLQGYGGLKMVKVVKKPEMKPGEGEVLVRVKACGLNFLDLMVRQGVIDNPPKTPMTMGFECAGEVEELGENVSDFAVGDRVIAFKDYGSWAELVPVNAQYLYKMPTSMSFQDGAALPMNYLTAYMMLFEIGNLRKGQSVLVHSVGGGVGHAVCQLTKTVEDVITFGTASYGKHEAIKNNLHHVFDHVVDYSQEIKKVCPGGVDIVLDCLCGEDTNKGISLLKPMGRYVLYGSSNIVTGETKSFFSFAKSWWQVDKINPIKLYDENKTISGFTLRHLAFKQGRHEFLRECMDKLFQLYNQGKIRPQIDSAWAFEDVSEAMQKMHDRKNIGKIILDPGLQPKPKNKPENSGESHEGGDETKPKEQAAEQ